VVTWPIVRWSARTRAVLDAERRGTGISYTKSLRSRALQLHMHVANSVPRRVQPARFSPRNSSTLHLRRAVRVTTRDSGGRSPRPFHVGSGRCRPVPVRRRVDLADFARPIVREVQVATRIGTSATTMSQRSTPPASSGGVVAEAAASPADEFW